MARFFFSLSINSSSKYLHNKRHFLGHLFFCLEWSPASCVCRWHVIVTLSFPGFSIFVKLQIHPQHKFRIKCSLKVAKSSRYDKICIFTHVSNARQTWILFSNSYFNFFKYQLLNQTFLTIKFQFDNHLIQIEFQFNQILWIATKIISKSQIPQQNKTQINRKQPHSHFQLETWQQFNWSTLFKLLLISQFQIRPPHHYDIDYPHTLLLLCALLR